MYLESKLDRDNFSEIVLVQPHDAPKQKSVTCGQKQVFWDYICVFVRKVA